MQRQATATASGSGALRQPVTKSKINQNERYDRID
jgi:hypothetical protein